MGRKDSVKLPHGHIVFFVLTNEGLSESCSEEINHVLYFS